ncbi:Mitochondrial large ribosomal subunit L49 [Rasamsonia emersonii CBS 393.64]|uniref:Large ribosomal subunit protein mL49 n=1 Tax=Rasamsonia emersonii (strain ATCC 16479 / CBS 393.64 / IMI 116815) TaxID=1408163 RepID=A0A0F4YTA0_RASE3|nr:Mitochondrial large ribosomal subunit L49 [Rasamsonia emersonii CBS 393.64]KKA21315.1 Mitochondrial large ribosomal subunit L49 [Rasamsonia emersonii CBS 393.64]
MAASSSMSSAIRQQLLPVSASPFSSSMGSIRAFSMICSPTRHAQSQNVLQLACRVSSARSFPCYQQSRTFLAKLSRKSQATAQTTAQTTNKSSNGQANAQSNQTQAPPLQLTNLPYFVRRTPSNQLPVYLVTKAGGTKQLTKIQKTEGDVEALRTDLARALGLESGEPGAKKSPDVTVNRLNGHIIVKVRLCPR